VETDDFNLSLLLKYLGPFLFIPEYLLFYFKRFLLENFRYSVNLADIAGLALTNILGVPCMLNIARSDILSLILFIANTRGYVSFTSFGYRITKGNKTTIVIFGWHNKKKKKPWLSSEISYIILKRRGRR
jgi:hypothetical protein